MSEAEGQDGSIIFTNRAREEITKIQLLSNYEDYPEETNFTEVQLQEAQNQQEAIPLPVQVEDNNDNTNNDVTLDPYPESLPPPLNMCNQPDKQHNNQE
eukprot:7990786-Ditylum_brightwellii.AAC.1